ncbi:MAG TPA: hypothetical protein VHJ58_09195 [Vicinamibacterales bacterium]|jgi:hypothetical protein|nr:hypothetical protein [Vicinamibacterales bacterium]
MRFTPVVAATIVLALSGSAFAQEWIEFTSREDRFTGNFPSQPKVTQTTYQSQYGADLPARVYSAEQGPSRYSMTVVDYSQIEKILTAKAQTCKAHTEGCYGGTGFSGVGHWRLDYHGALLHATWKLMERDAKVTQLTWSTTYSVGGHQVHLTNRDGSRTMAAIYMHNQRLYVIEGTVPAGYPEPALFQQSFGWLDEKGNEVRYQSLYHHAFPAPPRGAPPNQENPGNP